jgi:hypothetical protein
MWMNELQARIADRTPHQHDLTACGRCATTVSYAESWPWGVQGGRICISCLAVAAERRQLERAADWAEPTETEQNPVHDLITCTSCGQDCVETRPCGNCGEK